METGFILVAEPRPYVLQVTLNRPEVANAFNTATAEALIKLFEGLAINSEDKRCVVITGAGDKAFCAGADLKERQGMSESEWHQQHRVYERMIKAIIDCPLPVIAAVNGAAYGGGCEIAAAADFVYAAPQARFAQTETRLGIIPGAGGTQTVTRALGERRAKEVILSGQAFDANEALAWGLVNEVFDADFLLDQTLNTAEAIAGNAPIAVRQAKQAIHRGLQMSLTEGMAFEVEAYNRCVGTRDRTEGINAFNEKRRPKFTGE